MLHHAIVIENIPLCGEGECNARAGSTSAPGNDTVSLASQIFEYRRTYTETDYRDDTEVHTQRHKQRQTHKH
jgi:hypothetical protein